MGKRKRLPKVPIESDKKPVAKKGWSLEDKENLLTALRTYGHTNIHSIATMLPNKTIPAIRIMIHKTMQKAKTLSKSKDSMLDDWLEFFKEEIIPIPEALKFIALFEDHPSPEESGGFDFRAAYDYLHRMTLGQAAINLPEETFEKLNKLINEVRDEVWNAPDRESEAIRYLANLEKKKSNIKTYPPKESLHSLEIKNNPTNDEGAI